MTDYKLVPVEPTLDMLCEGMDVYGSEDCAEADVLGIYKAMLDAAPAVQGEPGVKWAPEEVENGNKGIRWVSDEGVHGRPTDHDCRVYLESNPNARGCHCPECTMLAEAPQPAEQQPDRDVRMLAASLYQACGAYDMPTRVLDVLSAAANGEPFAHMIDGLLPCVPPSNQDVQGEPVGYIRKSALELMKSDELGVRANIIKEPRYQDCVPLYLAPQPAPDVAGLVEALEASPHRLHDSIDGEDDCRFSQCKFVRLRDAALAAYRKGDEA